MGRPLRPPLNPSLDLNYIDNVINVRLHGFKKHMPISTKSIITWTVERLRDFNLIQANFKAFDHIMMQRSRDFGKTP